MNCHKEKSITDRLEAALDALAAIEHDRWAHWQLYVHSKATRNEDGSLTIPVDLVERWERQITTPFDDLTTQEKDSDREQVRRYLPTVVAAISP